MSEAKIHEIVIIKRAHGHGEEGHHGGVWKIAFADFMTAMMAFFLVMWLISASDKNKATIARYFNPAQLVDATSQPPGLSDPTPGAKSNPKAEKPHGNSDATADKPGTDDKPGKSEEAVENEKAAADNKPMAPSTKGQPDAGKTEKRDEARLFKDPYAVLAELDAKNSAQPGHPASKSSAEGTLGGPGAVGIKAGEAYRDPFEPLTFPSPTLPTSDQPAKDDADAEQAPLAPTQAQAGRPPGAPARDATPAEARPLGESLKAKIAALQGSAGLGATSAREPRIEVRTTGEGTLIDVTDGANFSMFASASAEPAPKLVALMAKIGKLLKAEHGAITVRGYTDSRPFKSETYDNWRLSAARAQMAHYMLVRGGLEDARFDRIEGHADRHPRNPKDPENADNRRIEILVQQDAP